jgi:glycosyltransferase involved in cell wall biosynthesis
MRKKILYICSIDTDQVNACLVHTMSIANAFAKIGHHVDMIFPGTGDHEKLKIFGGLIKLFPKFKLKKIPFKNAITGLFHTFFIIKHIAQHKIDVVYSRAHILSFFAIFCIRAFTRTTIVSEHNGDFFDEVQSSGYSKLLAAFAKYFQIFDMKFSHFIRVVTPGMKKVFISYGIKAEKIFVVGNGTNTSFFKPMERGEVLKKLNLDPQKTYVGFIGNLVTWQGVDWVLNPISTLIKNQPNLCFIIAGSGSLLSDLKRQASELGLSDHVLFYGNVDYHDAPWVINAFDIALAPFMKSRNERIGLSPLKIRDYAACGCPVLASRIQGIDTHHAEGGIYLFEPENEKDFSIKLEYLLDNKQTLNEMAKNARTFAEKNYDWQHIAEQILSHIEVLKD